MATQDRGRVLRTNDDVHRFQGRLWKLGQHRLDFPVRYVALGGFLVVVALLWPLFCLPGFAPIAYIVVAVSARLATVTDDWPMGKADTAGFAAAALLFWIIFTHAQPTLRWNGMAILVAAAAAWGINLYIIDRLGERNPRAYAELMAREGLTWLRHRRQHARRPLPSLVSLRTAQIRPLADRRTGDR